MYGTKCFYYHGPLTPLIIPPVATQNHHPQPLQAGGLLQHQLPQQHQLEPQYRRHDDSGSTSMDQQVVDMVDDKAFGDGNGCTMKERIGGDERVQRSDQGQHEEKTQQMEASHVVLSDSKTSMPRSPCAMVCDASSPRGARAQPVSRYLRIYGLSLLCSSLLYISALSKAGQY